MDLHTDGTYVKEVTDWLLMTKIEEKNVEGGETAMLHLDDWEYCEELFNDPVGKQNFVWSSPKSKNIDYKVCLLYTSPSPRDVRSSRMPSSA